MTNNTRMETPSANCKTVLVEQSLRKTSIPQVTQSNRKPQQRSSRKTWNPRNMTSRISNNSLISSHFVINKKPTNLINEAERACAL